MSLGNQEISQAFSSAPPLHGDARPASWGLGGTRVGAGSVGNEIRRHGFRFLRMLFILVLTAFPAGLAGLLFRESVFWANAARAERPGLIYALPVCGLLIAALYRVCRIGCRSEFSGLLASLRFSSGGSSERPSVSPFLTPLVFASSVLSHLFGASVGCEGASLLVGGGIGAQSARFFRLSGWEYSAIVLCAMASAFSPLLGAPFTAAVFVLERCGVRRVSFLFPCLLASFLSFEVASCLGSSFLRFEIEQAPEFTAYFVFQTLLFSVVCVFAGVFFRLSLRVATRLTDRFLPNRFAAMGFGGALILALTLLLNTQDYCGTSSSLMTAAFFGSAAPTAFFWKIFFTSLALGIGFKGGQIVPAFFVGTTLGCVLAPYFGFDAPFAAALGMVVLFATVVRCPLASLLLALELFSGSAFLWFIPAVLASAVPQRLAKRFPIP